MAWYPDLSDCTYFGEFPRGRLLAVGWLAPRKPFTKGPIDEATLDMIEALADTAPHTFVFRGFHICELCRPAPPFRLHEGGRRLATSSHLNIFVPCGDNLFVAPQCLPHYITSHEYQPPAVFLDAVRACEALYGYKLLEAIESRLWRAGGASEPAK